MGIQLVLVTSHIFGYLNNVRERERERERGVSFDGGGVTTMEGSCECIE